MNHPDGTTAGGAPPVDTLRMMPARPLCCGVHDGLRHHICAGQAPWATALAFCLQSCRLKILTQADINSQACLFRAAGSKPSWHRSCTLDGPLTAARSLYMTAAPENSRSGWRADLAPGTVCRTSLRGSHASLQDIMGCLLTDMAAFYTHNKCAIAAFAGCEVLHSVHCTQHIRSMLVAQGLPCDAPARWAEAGPIRGHVGLRPSRDRKQRKQCGCPVRWPRGLCGPTSINGQGIGRPPGSAAPFLPSMVSSEPSSLSREKVYVVDWLPGRSMKPGVSSYACGLFCGQFELPRQVSMQALLLQSPRAHCREGRGHMLICAE